MNTNGPRLRSVLEDIPTYVPGRLPVDDESVEPFKLSSNENPYPPLPSVVRAIENAATCVNRYPDMFATDLVNAIAARFGVPAEHIATGTGSVGVAQQLLQATAAPGDEVIYAWRSFEAYPILVQISGATSVPIQLTPDERHDLKGMADAVSQRTRLIFVCSPNNPTGTAVRRDEIERFLDRVPPDVLVVIDEAYREFVREPEAADGLELYRRRPNVCVLRTFSKAYGLASLRVGYAIAREPVAAALRKCAVPFGVNGIAQAAAVSSLAAEDELLERVEDLVTERNRVREALCAQGWAVPPSDTNFVWLRLADRTAEFAAACERAGTVVRAFAGEGCRVTIGEAIANDIIVAVAARFSERY